MGQAEVLDFLKANQGVKFTAKEISGAMKISERSIQDSLSRLGKAGDVRIMRVRDPKRNIIQNHYVYVGKVGDFMGIVTEIRQYQENAHHVNSTDAALILILQELRLLRKLKEEEDAARN